MSFFFFRSIIVTISFVISAGIKENSTTILKYSNLPVISEASNLTKSNVPKQIGMKKAKQKKSN